MVLSRPCSAPLATDNVARRRQPVKRKENSRDVQTACGNVQCSWHGGGGGGCAMFMVQGV